MSSQQAQPATPSGKGKTFLLILVVVGIVSAGAGALAPQVIKGATHKSADTKEPEGEDEFLPFGDVTVNLHEGRLNRYLRVKIVVVATQANSKEVEKKLEQQKVTLKNWLISHLSDKTLQDVAGRASINRLRREILEHFNTTLYPEGDGHLRDVFFEEFMVQ